MLRSIIIDDEQLALRHLEKQLRQTKMVDIVGAFTNATEFLKEMRGLQFDVAFLDIEMPGLSGLDLADLIKDWNKDIFIVFVTASRDYAIQAFELHSIDYLLKPILLDRLEITTFRIQEQISMHTDRRTIGPSQTNSMKIICFKEFNVYHNNIPVKWKTAKVKELFAYFLTHLNSPIQRDTIIDVLWPDADYQRAKIQLHTTLSYLRKEMESIGYTDAISFSNGSYSMHIDGFQCDAHQFEKIVENHPFVTEDNIDMFEEIVQQYDGDYMQDMGYEWSLPKAHAIRQELLHLLQTMVNYFSENYLQRKQLHYLQLLVSYTPYSEYAIQQLMQFHVDNGNRGQAVKVYHQMKTLLSEELGILPDPSTTELYNSIVQ